MLTPDIATDLVGESLRLVMLMVLLLIGPGLIVGLLVALFQAATQINEQTMSFLPRLLVTLLAIMLMGHWLTGALMDFCVSVFQRAALLVG
ncbi:flagellar type III secretion system protein FliQ [Azoarcus sp. TTM-91]|uniref:Flagellar biosynthetic protein FliQ n=1 Tax=Azoarcus indigens TaxID=29545 RepID=A0A4R6EH15_9RHOO|nr:flagellar type III secretion system protein FliQ [Azoarcus sp. TTM-91]NMG63552.1 flagellar type III secretion system protein FliQ [Azoarcus indigens]TDN57103.1 flagellar biosynthetic protein FliQ [Azoarcus indigens]